MCGLYSFGKSPEETRNLFNYLERPDFPPRSYVAPGGPIAIVRAEKGERHFILVRWGLVPAGGFYEWTRPANTTGRGTRPLGLDVVSRRSSAPCTAPD